MVPLMIAIADEPDDLAFQIAGEELVFQQDTVLEGLMPSLDLALGLWMVGCATNMIHAVVVEPFS